MEKPKVVLKKGWHPEEKGEGFFFHWIGKRSSFSIENITSEEKRYVHFTAGHSFPEEGLPIMEIYLQGRKISEEEIEAPFASYAFPLKGRGNLEIEFVLNKSFSVPGDNRDLGVMIRDLEIISQPEETAFLGGWYGEEKGEFFPFRWMKKKSCLLVSTEVANEMKYLSFYAFSEYGNLSQKLSFYCGGRKKVEIPLLHGWNFYSLELFSPDLFSSNQGRNNWLEVELLLNKLFPSSYHPRDGRELGARFSRLEFHQDDRLHQNASFYHRNAVLNYREMIEGKTSLSSYPKNLGIDLYSKCNIKPPCVYCLWHSMKKLEGEYVKENVDEKTLEGYGPFFLSARTLVNCSFGEPLLHPRLPQILEYCARNKKFLEISTNGQAFSERIIKTLAGKPVFLYISLDAARKETYSKIRNDKWDSIIPHLLQLHQERKKNNNLPKIYMVFMPMKVNRDDLEEYFRLCQQIEADALVLRPLLYLHESKIEAHRGGYHFVYKDELLSREEIEKILEESRIFSKKYKIPVASQFDFGRIKEPGEEGIAESLTDFQRS